MDTMHPFHTIVVAVDFSETSADAVRTALQLVRGQQARLHLLHVTNDALHMLGVTEAPGVDWAEVQRKFVEEARARLLELAANCALDPQLVTIAVEVGPAAPEIIRYAAAHDAQLIVLGSHGHGIVRRFLLGSVADRLLRQAACPVMLVPHRSIRLTSFEVKAASGIED
jgi:nucleotide-binding universal stress UspA family protein